MSLSGREYWRSLGQLSGNPEFETWLHREFQENATEMGGRSRRTMLKLMAASLGLAGLTACRRPEEKILPFAKGVEELIPGKPVFYATSYVSGGVASGLLVETHDGRPTKIEGNPRHPYSLGATSAFMQASLLGLYDPDRSRTVLRQGRQSSWEELDAFLGSHFDAARIGDGAGFWILAEPLASPSTQAVKDALQKKYPAMRWAEYEPLNQDNARQGAQLAFGQPLEAHYHYDKAQVIVSLDYDFLGLDSPTVLPLKQFARGRRVASEKDSMNRLYVAESQFSITGAMADHRLRMRAGDVKAAARMLAEQLGLLSGGLNVLNNGDAGRKWMAAAARDLKAHSGRCLVVAGPRQPAEVHALVHLINQALGNFGQTVVFTPSVFAPAASIQELGAAMAAGQVKTLLILGGNPVFNAPADLEFAANLKKVATSIHLGQEADETATRCSWHIPAAHYLESWGDVRALNGLVSLQQPMIAPLYNGRTAVEVLAKIAAYPQQRAYDVVRNYWIAQWPAAEAEKRWRRALHDGVVAGTEFAPVTPVVDAARVKASVGGDAPPGMEVVFYPNALVYDGRFANNGWMQEAPDPMTKLTWDNAALLSPATAAKLGVSTGDMIRIELEGKAIQAPAFIQPGQADNSIALAVGHGRSVCGRVGRGVGHNVYPLRTSKAMWIAGGVTVSKTGRTYRLVTTQDHHSMEGRAIVREASLEDYRKEPNFAGKPEEHLHLFSLYEAPVQYNDGHQWGMAIDLNACVGCNACLVACQAENNIPIVGKNEVARGREMHWIRLDRYFTGDEEDPQAVVQPMACQQCENAPCENVCPVAATVHSPEGLNDMAYNRCIGTRYCANNCPYKVRRFNFLNWHKDLDEVGKMVFNPDVTVRMRGVMEKCTYCVQRIQEKKIQAKAEGRRPLKDGEIVTACQQVCPAEAIVFGDLNDPSSQVSRMHRQNRRYTLLAELNTKPRTAFLAKLRNPNPELS